MRADHRWRWLLALVVMLLLAGPLPGTGAAAATGLPEISARQGQPQPDPASIRITFLACPDTVTDPAETPGECTEPVAAPDDAVIGAAPDFIIRLDELTTDETGVYLREEISPASLTLAGITPTDFNYLTIVGGDERSPEVYVDDTRNELGWTAPLNLEDGEDREVTVFYWNGPDGLIEPAESTLRITLVGCDAGIDPADDGAVCDQPVPATDDMAVGGFESRRIDTVASEGAGTYLIEEIPPYTGVTLSGLEHPDYGSFRITGDVDATDEFGSETYVVRGESLDLTVTYSDPLTSGTPAPRPSRSDAATIRVSLVSCPEGVEPREEPEQCVTPLDDDGRAVVTAPDGTETALIDLPRDGDAYLLTDIPAGDYRLSGLNSDVREFDLTGTDAIEGNANDVFVISLGDGETSEIVVYYYDFESTL